MKKIKFLGFLLFVNIFLPIFVFKISAVATVTSISPASGSAAGGTNLVIDGAGFLEETSFAQLSAGGIHSLAIASNGKLYAWGNNQYGQLGNNSTTSFSLPTVVDTSGVLAGKTITAIAAGSRHSLVLDSEGKVYAWGRNANGQLGNNSTTQSLIPVAVDTSGVLAGKTITAIAAGENHSLVLDSEGKVYAWGYNANGQSGNNSTTQSLIPVAVDTSGVLAGKTITAIAAANTFSLALSSEGKVYAWGGSEGLGNNTFTQSLIPVAVDTSGVLAGKTIATISTGFNHVLALDSVGKVYAWGYNSYGQLGNNSTTVSWVPVAVDITGVLSGKTITRISGGGSFSLVLDSEGKVYAWGYNANGQLGNNSTTQSLIPIAVDKTGVLAGKTITTIATKSSHSLVLDTDGKVHAWGSSGNGQLGNGFDNSYAKLPVAVDMSGTLSGKTVSMINLGTIHSLALDTDGKVYAWGRSDSGQLGNNSTALFSVANAVDTTGVLAGKTITAIAASTSWEQSVGPSHSLALDTDGKVYAWGYNSSGQLGNNSLTQSLIPVEVDTSGVLAGKTITAIAAGQKHSLALDSDGKVYAWGLGVNGRLGNNSTVNSSVPVEVDTSGVLAGKTITAIAAGDSFSLALDSDGKVYAWGYNGNGQLGNNSLTQSLIPLEVDMSGVLAGKTITAIAAGSNFSLALDFNGKVYAWGANSSGQLGNNSDVQSLVPIAVDITGVLAGKIITAIDAGDYFSLALDSDGKVYAWGYNGNGQLGNNSLTKSSIPVAVDMTGVLAGKTITKINAGSNFAMVLSSAGKAYTWGRNYDGQLGTYDFYGMFDVNMSNVNKYITSVGFGGTNAENLGTNFVLNSTNQLTVTSPAHSEGLVDLILTNNFGEQTTIASTYTYLAAANNSDNNDSSITSSLTDDNEDEEDENEDCTAQKPNSPTLTNVQRNSSTQATVFWSQGNGEVTHWYVTYEKKGGGSSLKITISNASIREYKIENLDPTADYTFTVIQANGCRESDISNAFNLESTEKNVVKPIVKISTTKVNNQKTTNTEDTQMKTKNNGSTTIEASKEAVVSKLTSTKTQKNVANSFDDSLRSFSSFVSNSFTVMAKSVETAFFVFKDAIWSLFK